MGYLSGSTGKILFARADTALTDDGEAGWIETPTRVQKWSLNTTAALLDATSLGDYDKKTVYGLRTTTGTLKLFYYTEEIQSTPKSNSASWFFNALCRADTTGGDASLPAYTNTKESLQVRLRLYLMDTSTTVSDFIDLDANLTSVSIGSSVGEIVSVDVGFQATVATKGTAANLRSIDKVPVRRSNL